MGNNLEPIDFAKLGALDFEAPRLDAFPALRLAREAGETGGSLPAVMNAANEIAVELFLDRRIKFTQIWQTVERVMQEHQVGPHPSLEELIEADALARQNAHQLH